MGLGQAADGMEDAGWIVHHSKGIDHGTEELIAKALSHLIGKAAAHKEHGLARLKLKLSQRYLYMREEFHGSVALILWGGSVDTVKRIGDDLLMVEGQRVCLRQGHPLCLGCIIAPAHWGCLLKPSSIGHGDNPLTGVAAYGIEDTYRTNCLKPEPGLLLKLPQRSVLGGFVDVHKSSGKGPAVFIGSVAPTD